MTNNTAAYYSPLHHWTGELNLEIMKADPTTHVFDLLTEAAKGFRRAYPFHPNTTNREEADTLVMNTALFALGRDVNNIDNHLLSLTMESLTRAFCADVGDDIVRGTLSRPE